MECESAHLREITLLTDLQRALAVVRSFFTPLTARGFESWNCIGKIRPHGRDAPFSVPLPRRKMFRRVGFYTCRPAGKTDESCARPVNGLSRGVTHGSIRWRQWQGTDSARRIHLPSGASVHDLQDAEEKSVARISRRQRLAVHRRGDRSLARVGGAWCISDPRERESSELEVTAIALLQTPESQIPRRFRKTGMRAVSLVADETVRIFPRS